MNTLQQVPKLIDIKNKPTSELIDIKSKADQSYYNTTSVISDVVYDRIVEELSSRGFSSTEVGTPHPKDGFRIDLPVWMGSLDKLTVKTPISKISEFIKNKNEIVVTTKLDGISCLLVYQKERFKNRTHINLYTRGNGKVGGLITRHLPRINYIPVNLKKSIIIRGELICSNSRKYIDEGKYSTKRNMVSSLINSNTINNVINVIDFIAYEIINISSGGTTPSGVPKQKCYISQIYELIDLGFKVPKFRIYPKSQFVKEPYTILSQIYRELKKESHYDIDGIVLTQPGIYIRNTSKNPDYQIAFKCNSTGIETTITEIKWIPSRTGRLIPTVYITPTQVQGVTIKKLSGHSAKYIIDNGLGGGAQIRIIRSGEVIPYITEVIRTTPISYPKYGYKWDDSRVHFLLNETPENGGEICSLPSSDILIEKQLYHFFKTIGTRTLGPGTIHKLYVNGYNDIWSILETTPQDLEQDNLFTSAGSEKLCNNIKQAIIETDLVTLITASGVLGRGFGFNKIKVIYQHWPNVHLELPQYITTSEKKKGLDRLITMSSISYKLAERIINGAKKLNEFTLKLKNTITKHYKSQGAHILNQLNGRDVNGNDISRDEPSRDNNSFQSEYHVVFTGFRDSALTKWLKDNLNYIVKNNITPSTLYLITNKTGVISRKTSTAIKYNVKIVSKVEFYSIVGYPV